MLIGTSVDHISLNATGGFLQLDGAQLQDGTQALAPSMTFEDDTDTGSISENWNR